MGRLSGKVRRTSVWNRPIVGLNHAVLWQNERILESALASLPPKMAARRKPTELLPQPRLGG